MRRSPNLHHRRSIRLPGYDYSQPGAYFVTICTHDKACLFGDVVHGRVLLTPMVKLVEKRWTEIPKHFPCVEVDEFVVMPNHLHGILMIVDVGRGTASSDPVEERFGHPVRSSIPTIIRSFKSAATKIINEAAGTTGTPIWQRNYYEHIIRGEKDLTTVREYIRDNPAKWTIDKDNPWVQRS